MSTRAVYTFVGDDQQYHVYKHHDGYPSGACGFINKAFEKAWPLPRYEADECAAAFVAANKAEPGGVRLLNSDIFPSDTAYHYIIMQAINGQIIVKAFEYNGEDSGEPIFYGRLKDWLAQIAEESSKERQIENMEEYFKRVICIAKEDAGEQSGIGYNDAIDELEAMAAEYIKQAKEHIVTPKKPAKSSRKMKNMCGK